MKILAIGDLHGELSEKLLKKLKKENFDLVMGVGDYAGVEEFRPYFKKFFKLLKEKGEYLSAEEYFGKRYQKLLERDYRSGKEVLKKLSGLGKQIIIVFGNSDWYEYPFDKKFKKDKRRRYEKHAKKLGVSEITYGSIRYGGLKIVGFGGYMETAGNISGESDKKRLKKRLLRMSRAKKKLFSLLKKQGKTDILLLHYTPKGAFDIIKDRKNPFNGKNAGVTILREAIRKYKPKLVLCGHMHEYQGMKKLFGIPVINPGEAKRGRYALINFDEKSGKVKGVKFSK